MLVDVATISRAFRIALVAATSGWVVGAMAGEPGDPARVGRAIAYLDGRQEAWSRFAGADRGAGAGKTTCVSCHTGISYALARPALGRFASGPGPAPGPAEPELRMLAAVGLRDAHRAELDSPRFRLMYDHTERKKVESRGTEAVLNSLILARADADRGRAEPTPATRDALRHLWATQATSGVDAGSWDWLDFGLEPWEADGSRAFGAALAAIAVGSAPGYSGGKLDEADARGLALLRDYLRRRLPEESAYNRLWILEASTRLEGLLSAEQKKEVVDQLLADRGDDGGWSLAALGDFRRVDGSDQSRDPDGHATGLVLHTLLRAGLPADHPELAKGLGWLRSHQQDDGSWPGISVNKKRDPATFIGKLMSDAATAFAALALVEAESSPVASR